MGTTPSALRANYTDFFGDTMLPVLEEIFRSELSLHPPRWKEILQTKTTDRDIYQASERHDMPLYTEVPEGTDYSFESTKQGANQTFVIKKYGLGFSISMEAVEDGKFEEIADAIRKMGDSAQESQEIQGMDVINNGFTTTTTNDGVALFSTAHTLPRGGTFRNRLSADADLSVTSLETMLTDFETQFIGDTGQIKRITPRVILVHPENKRLAKELIGSELKAATAENAALDSITNVNNMNSFREEGLRIISSPHLTDTDSWYMLAEPARTGLRAIVRSGVQTIAAGADAGFRNDSILYKSRYRWEVGATDPYGVFGTTGA
jgi:phage major head subunit gpT-like protein